MDSTLLQKRDLMIVALQQHLGHEESNSFADPYSCSQAFQATVGKLADQFGHDADVQGHILFALDELLTHKTSQVVRTLGVQLAQCAATAQTRAAAPEATGYEIFSQRLSAYWRLLLLNDPHTTRAAKINEVEAVATGSTSPALRQQAQALRPLVSGLGGASPRPALW